MKKNFVKLLLAGLLVFGVLCFMGCKSDDDDVEKSIKITGLSEYNGQDFEVDLWANDGDYIAFGFGTVEGGSAVSPLYKGGFDLDNLENLFDPSKWTGEGSYDVDLMFDSKDFKSKEKISFSSETTTLHLNDFEPR